MMDRHFPDARGCGSRRDAFDRLRAYRGARTRC